MLSHEDVSATVTQEIIISCQCLVYLIKHPKLCPYYPLLQRIKVWISGNIIHMVMREDNETMVSHAVLY